MRPRILLIDGGGFGLERLAAWHRLAAEGEVEVATCPDPTDEQLGRIDAVDLVAPVGSRAALIRRCLPFAHVLVEAPLSTDTEEAVELATQARALGRILVASRPCAADRVVDELARLVSLSGEKPRAVSAAMIDPDDECPAGDRAHLELQQLSELAGIVERVLDAEPEVASVRRRDRSTHVSLRYPGPINAVLRVGRTGRHRIREVQLIYPERRCSADLADNVVTVSTRNNQLHKSVLPDAPQDLDAALRSFAASVREPARRQSGPAAGERIARLAARPHARRTRPRVAVIGGGIFGTTCALELAPIADVTLFERHAELLTETSSSNQRRHHSGFHYPRSYDTVVEIRAARQLFEDVYGDAIDRSFPSYYCTSATGIEIPAERYLAACRSNQLSFAIVDPPAEIVDAAAVSLCLATDEAVYDVRRLRQIVTERIAASPGVRCELGTAVLSGDIGRDGTKRLSVSGPAGAREESFDYLVNATYAGRNMVAQWFGFATEPLRFDLYELLLLRLPVPQVCVTILDGPFTSLMGTGRDDLFLLSHIHDSVSRSVIPEDGAPPRWQGLVSNRANMLRHAQRYLPVVGKASDVQSVWLTRAVDAFARDFDARPTVVTEHGFGCWSVLGGKVVTTVANAREIARAIGAEQATDA